jgi:hypothetical protein
MLSCFILQALVCACVLSSVFVADRGSQRASVFGKVERERERERVLGNCDLVWFCRQEGW